jgi:SAM-dependent methyltransferase
MAILGVGDLHPGGLFATDTLLCELARIEPRRVLEVGAGIGLTTERMIKRGWQVTPIEPNYVMRKILDGRLGIEAYPKDLATFTDRHLYDAVIAESVLYKMDLPRALSQLSRLLRPGGLLALNDMVWTNAAEPSIASIVHDETKRRFGIPMTSKEMLRWSDWKRVLVDAGFVEIFEERLSSDLNGPNVSRRWQLLFGGLRHPLAFKQYLTYRRGNRLKWAPPGWLESWISIWRRADSA